jgi:hypothetical protein
VFFILPHLSPQFLAVLQWRHAQVGTAVFPFGSVISEFMVLLHPSIKIAYMSIWGEKYKNQETK